MSTNYLDEMLNATDEMFKVIESNLGEIDEVIIRLKQIRHNLNGEADIAKYEADLKELNAGAGIITTGIQGIMMSMYAPQAVGNPAEHLDFYMNKAIGSLKEVYVPTRGKVSDESKEQTKVLRQ